MHLIYQQLTNKLMKQILALVVCCWLAMPSFAQTVIPHPWQGKKVAYFGDSITDPNNKASDTKYWNCLEQWLGITPYVYAVSGRQWTDIPRQADCLMKEHGDSIDAIVILMGTNDYNNGIPLGRWYDEQTEDVMYAHGKPKALTPRKRQHLCMTDSTYRGRINIAMAKVRQMYPDKQLVLLTPIHRGGFYLSDTNWQCTEDYANQCGSYLQDYVAAVKEAANVWAVTVIDMNALCGLYPLMDSHAKYFNNGDTDRLHPNNLGHRRMAQVLMQQLLTVPCF